MGGGSTLFLHPPHRLGHSRGQERNKTRATTGPATRIFLSRTGREEVEGGEVEGPEWRWLIPGLQETASLQEKVSFATSLETKLWEARSVTLVGSVVWRLIG